MMWYTALHIGIEYALMIRPLNTEPLSSLYSMLSQKHGCENAHLNNNQKKENNAQESEISMIFKGDDLESFIKKSSEIGFDPKSKIEADSDSPISFVNGMQFYKITNCEVS